MGAALAILFVVLAFNTVPVSYQAGRSAHQRQVAGNLAISLVGAKRQLAFADLQPGHEALPPQVVEGVAYHPSTEVLAAGNHLKRIQATVRWTAGPHSREVRYDQVVVNVRR